MGISSGPPVGFFPERLLSEKEEGGTMTQPKDNTGREELVEEIVWVMHECFVEAAKVPDYDYFSVLHDYAEKLVTFISQAIADGMALPGEVGRKAIPKHGMNREEALKELLLRRSYRAVEIAEGVPVQFVGVYVLRWGKVDQPTIGFVEWDDEAIEEALMEVIGKEEP